MRRVVFGLIVAWQAQCAIVTVTTDVIVPDAQRLGVNLPGPNDYGAENFMRNMIPNPGYEPGCWGSVVSTRGATSSSVVQGDYWDTTWNTANIGWPVDHWTGAEWEIPTQGLSGTVLDFTHDNDRPTFYLDQTVTLAWHEPLFLRKLNPPNGNPPRPGSNGVQSQYISSPGNTWQHVGTRYFDTLAKQGDPTAGTLRLIRGPHTIAFWAKSAGGPVSIEVTLARYPGSTITSAIVDLDETWQYYEHHFTGQEVFQAGQAPMLALSWRFRTEGTGFYLDDMFVGPDGDGAFADELVDALKFVRPGVIRFWQGLFGDNFDNMIADDYARRPREQSPRKNKAGTWGYSLPDALALCGKVGAIPWITIPPTLTDDDMARLGDYLSGWADMFDTIYVEYGNESWGTNNPYDDPFAGSSFDGGTWLGLTADRKFAAMGNVPNVQTIIGGQAAWAGQNQAIRNAAGPEHIIPIAPYFGQLGEAYATPEDMFYPLYARTVEDVNYGKPYQTRAYAGGIYEINFHTTGGAGGSKNPESKAIINSFVSSLAGGISLPVYMLSYARSFGWQPQCAFTMTQYSAGGIRIWGLYRDIMATGRPRPTAQALALVNKGIRGDMVDVEIFGEKMIEVPDVNGLMQPVTLPALQAFAWRDGTKWSLYLTNFSLEKSQHITLQGVPCQIDEAWQITKTDCFANNEDSAGVVYSLLAWSGSIPPHSAVLLMGTDPVPGSAADAKECEVPVGWELLCLAMLGAGAASVRRARR